jgi:hypothetical protein
LDQQTAVTAKNVFRENIKPKMGCLIACRAYPEHIKTESVYLIANNASQDNTNICPAMCRASIALQVGT